MGGGIGVLTSVLGALVRQQSQSLGCFSESLETWLILVARTSSSRVYLDSGKASSSASQIGAVAMIAVAVVLAACY